MALAQAAGDAPPDDPPGEAALLGPWMHQILVEDSPHLLGPPVVERRSAAWTQAEAGEVQPAGLVLRRAFALLLDLECRVEQGAAGGDGPLLARQTQCLLELLDDPGEVVVYRLGEDATEQGLGHRHARRQHRGRALRRLGALVLGPRSAGAHVEGQPPPGHGIARL